VATIPAVESSTWASCGAMYLTGDPDGPPLSVGFHDALRIGRLARHFGLDATLLGERASIAGLRRRGHTSCGGRSRMMPARDGWVTLSLARNDDIELLPAFVGVEASHLEEAWSKLTPEIRRRPAAELDEWASLLGIAFSVVGSATGPMSATGKARPGAHGARVPLVADLSALWAGPLCAQLLRSTGARVVKIEDIARPDGARGGTPQFFDLLNQGKLSVALDLRSSTGRSRLLDLLAASDVIVTSSRARAFDQLGVVVDEVLATTSDKVWTAITAYGWSSYRVGYGDDVAAGAGLVAWHPGDGEPRFASDAIADPLCGLEAAALVIDCLGRGGRWFVDASLAGSAVNSACTGTSAGPAIAVGNDWVFEDELVQAPRGRLATQRAHTLGQDTDMVLEELDA
jgi:CoA-transferase family III